MSTDMPSRSMTDVGRSERPWAAGLTVFAAAVMMISGVWHAFAGIGALVNDKVYVSTPRYIYSFDLTAWGWILITLGVVMALVATIEYTRSARRQLAERAPSTSA